MTLKFVIALLAAFALEGQTTTNAGQASAQWFSQHLPPPAGSNHAAAPSAPIAPKFFAAPQPKGPGSYVLTSCTTDAQQVSLFRSLSHQRLPPGEQHFVQTHIQSIESDMALRRC
jgi:hypothetical protein